MIKLAEKFDVLQDHFIKGKGVKTIAREMSLSKNTVKNYIREFTDQKAEIINGGDKSAILLAMSQKPTYNSANRERSVVTDQVIELIGVYLNENENKKTLGKGKLCMKATDIYEELLKKGIKISYPSVNNCVRQLTDARKEAFIKQHYEYGEVCEFDWGEVKLNISGCDITFRIAVFTLAATNIRYGILYRHENTQAFIDSHIRFFAFIGCVPHTMVYDNMKVAIAKFVGKHEKVATTALLQLSNYYGFSFRFCNIRKGNEKGHVERSVEYIRRKAFSSVSSFNSTEAAENRLAETITMLNAEKTEPMEMERAAMLPKMPDYSSVVRVTSLVDKFSTVTYKQNHYSVPDYLVGKEVETLAFVEEIVVKINASEVARHKRSHENHTYTLDIMHYRNTLIRKPGAVHGSLCLKQSSDVLKVIYDRFFKDKPKEFIMMLDLLSGYSLHKLKSAIDTLLEAGAKVQLDNIKMILGNKAYVAEPAFSDEIERACEAQLAAYGLAAAV
jgi:hypothetical protein